MQVELRDSSFDLGKLQTTMRAMEANAATQSSIQRVFAPFRSSVPRYTVEIDRVKTETCGLTATRCSRR
jgi:HAE1 family hydrophobic/amphiphilic exporter-1